MIITKIQGGLGNQMFQYAIARNLSKIRNEELKLDISYYKSDNKNNTPRKYSLKYFDIQENFINNEDIKKLKINNLNNRNILSRIVMKILKKIEEKKPIYNRSYIREYGLNFNENILKTKKKNIYLYGNWQNEKYFKNIQEIILKDFSLKKEISPEAKDFLKKINNSNSISIHIRRGDYVQNEKTNAYHGTCSLDYYKKAISIINKKIDSPKYFIFSDDIKWVKNNLRLKHSVAYVSNNNIPDYEEMILMSKCKHNIIANSSFSWWGAWLNNNLNKIVIAPQKWFNAKKIVEDLLPKKWIKL